MSGPLASQFSSSSHSLLNALACALCPVNPLELFAYSTYNTSYVHASSDAYKSHHARAGLSSEGGSLSQERGWT